jgi:hypothetical protein
MSKGAEVFQREETIMIQATIRDTDGELYDPADGCTISIYNSSGGTAVAGSGLTYKNPGIYYYLHTSGAADPTGWWHYRITARDGDKCGIQDGGFKIE